MKPLLKMIWNRIGNALGILVFMIALFMIVILILGWRPYTVLSGSMEPEYSVGSILFIRKTDSKKLKVGDVITFYQGDDTVVTHRIVEVILRGSDEWDVSSRVKEEVHLRKQEDSYSKSQEKADSKNRDEVHFRTKGDANDVADGSLVCEGDVIGSPVLCIPYLGYLSQMIKRMMVCISLAIS